MVVGAGITGVSAAIWLQRSGCQVDLIDRLEPGEGASFGNAGVLAACSVAPVTTPGIVLKAPRNLLDPDFSAIFDLEGPSETLSLAYSLSFARERKGLSSNSDRVNPSGFRFR